MRFCKACRDYTLQEACPRCGGKAIPNVPAKYSPEDPYGEYRRRLKLLDAGRAPPDAAGAEGAERPKEPAAEGTARTASAKP
jgi:H/ACA ribonucleoprotein complex subunit 3